ncbi:nuclear factor, interleukin 3 regulated, member 4 [Alosa sapidissima]|uniref:nuclear factor, interleukin 3 regulated, member 4 n=1 Tax=Alosa sapidissima TaxID=34773 RepID=UPI001C08A5D7|nr:nuclear factor, interleukin 3 regulated, member 4 [Alosa sapidissima]XP_041914054.1 nuclear factor, interleukin 3 regulated, member 4 [Alosa sapidissima]XP_041914055.1 nuclear factor, interleukin 3 regulated, member 4 [Alosa sapidissima]
MEFPFSLVEPGDDMESMDEHCLRGAGFRRKREFTPEERKDASYWEKRRKNNEAAKRSREKRRANDYLLEQRLMALSKENVRLQDELVDLKLRCGLAGPLGFNPAAAVAAAAFSAQHRGLRQLHTSCGLQPAPPPPLPPPPLSPRPPPPPLLLADKELVWGRAEGPQVAQVLPASYHHQRASSISPYPGPSAFTSPRAHTFSRAFPFLLDMPGVLSSPVGPASLLLPPLLVPSPGGPRYGPRLPVRPIPQQAALASDEEGEQQVPGASTGLDPRAALPHKLRLKTHKSHRDKGSTTTGTPSPPLYVSD